MKDSTAVVGVDEEVVGAVAAVPVRVRLLDVPERRAHDVAGRVLGAHPVLVPPGVHLRARRSSLRAAAGSLALDWQGLCKRPSPAPS